MSQTAILFPVAVLALWTLAMYCRLGLMRNRAIGNREVSIKYFRSYQGEQPEALQVASRHVVNLLEMPVLFYVVCLVIYTTQSSGLVAVSLAWLYVALRGLHSFIHLGSNNIRQRFGVFILSWAVLILLWLYWLVMALRAGV